MNNVYGSDMLQAIHEDMCGMYELGIIGDAEMREFDEDCLVRDSGPTCAAALPLHAQAGIRSVAAGLKLD